jgi:predicted nucleic acid-binding protein
MISPLFADTAYYLALVSARDALHARAVALSEVLAEPVVTSAWVIQELADALASPPARSSFLHLLDTLIADPETTIVEPDPALWRRGLLLYRSRADRRWSLTDCLSFEIMRERGITRALTSDHGFEQAGFRALLMPE